ncbi:tRNA (adenosine(37)-N6)-dimethylallyltransferase MiaA [Synechococcus sp. RSCCF101]|uniref:tRNA (adenosine(37)-N6)-dimethylallyltransferase MiaA n=1 Tax=Synechococcus sp. RSCCF101 TaxID=2511069 RepID=UPI0012484C30|nr:tRNA (adenosine(37)-N6)-dimethylallyltransferase MiaA [Synechococcus sp. RSCCF101]QEY32520.1 tRNA (adenosine(37)-N6)-dimethylallyltransferase MiaA [Synechococcus sp. RSCCF101]
MSTDPLVIVLLGPTAAGKSDLAIALAEALDLAVLSVDSRQVYRGMDVGTAKPTPAQRARVRHELLDLRDPDDPMSLHEFQAEAHAAIRLEHQRRGIALLAGGSGLYLKALTDGWQPPAIPAQPWLRHQFTGLGQEVCHALLRQCDPRAAERIAAADSVRTQRALEVLYGSGRPVSEQRNRRPPPWRVLELGLLPADLNRRIRERSASLYSGGLLEETQTLIDRYGADLPLLRTIGYGEAVERIRGGLRPEEALRTTIRRTQQLAKRQRTWFRRQHSPTWLPAGEPPLTAALTAIRSVLG